MKGKVTIKLQGGIGNNLFQIACAHAYSLKNDKELILLNEKFGAVHNALHTYKDNILSKINFLPTYNFSGFQKYNEPLFNYSEIPNLEGDVYLDGYFQSEKYFKEFEKEIRELLSYSSNVTEFLKDKKHTCSIHVRRGDYVNLQEYHPVQNFNYYMKAIKQMPEDSLFLVFSDDISWCKENFPNIPDKFIFVEGNKDYEDLLLMSSCDNNIICNSSFSWWAAWLNKNVNKKIIAPSTWFGKAISHDTNDLIPENWIKI